MMWGGGESDEPVDFMGMRDWHITTHGDPGGRPGELVIKMQAYLAAEFTYFVERLKSFERGRGQRAGQHGGGAGDPEREHQPDQLRQGRPRPAQTRPSCWRAAARAPSRPAACSTAAEVNHNDLYVSLARTFGLALDSFGEPSWCKGPLAAIS
jgi:hypothetical protein